MKLDTGAPGDNPQDLHGALAEMIRDPQFQQLGPEDRARQMERVVLAFTHAATQKMVQEDPDLNQKWQMARGARMAQHGPNALASNLVAP